VTVPPRLPAQFALAVAVVLATAVAPRPGSAAPVPPDACARALALEKTAASDAVSRQTAYDAAVAGLGENQSCADAQMHLVNEAYLLSMRAPAAHDLHVGDWRRDLTRANDLLLQCANWPGLKGTKAGQDCLTQRQYNAIVAKTLAAPAATPAPRNPAAPPPPPTLPPPTPAPSNR
jgi:hypothetical protein